MSFSLAFGHEFIYVRYVFKVVILVKKRNTDTFDKLYVGNAMALDLVIGFCFPLGLNLLNV